LDGIALEPVERNEVGMSLTVKQAAERLGVSPSLVYGLCAAGKIRHERHGLGRGCIRIPPEALDEYRRAAEVRPQAEPENLRHIRLN
jgi:excisionase family DNA binding protein